MRKSFGKELVFVFVLALCCACGGRVIPADKLSDIYADMLLADQWLSVNQRARRIADTTLFYEPIFRSYGYSLKDYEASVRHYMKKPADFSKILDRSSKNLQAYSKRLQAVEDEIKARRRYPPFSKIDFNADTVLWQLDTNALKRDSVNICDTLVRESVTQTAPDDSLSFTTDSTVKKTITDTIDYGQKRNIEKMLLVHGPHDTASRRHSVKRKIFGGKSDQAAQ